MDTMTQGVNLLEESEKLLAQAEEKLKNFQDLRLRRFVDRTEETYHKIEEMQKRIRDAKKSMIENLAILVNAMGQQVFSAGSIQFDFRKSSVDVSIKRRTNTMNYWQYIDEYWSGDLCRQMIQVIRSNMAKLPETQAAQIKETDELNELGKELISTQ